MAYHESYVSRQVKESYRSCDVCGNKSGRHQCTRCNRDTCKSCTHSEYEPEYTDYPTHYCKDCWVAGESFRARKRYEEDRCEAEVARIDDEYQKVCDGIAKQKAAARTPAQESETDG